MNENQQRERIVEHAASLYSRCLSLGTSGNISVRLDDGWLMTPTGRSMGDLDPARLSRLDREGNWLSGDQPTKEALLHLAMYRQRPSAGAVVHLHSSHSVAVSCLAGLDTTNVLPPLTAYYVMRVGNLPLVPYFAPGDPELASAITDLASRHRALLLANHGPIIADQDLDTTVYAIEELEATAKLYLLLRALPTCTLTAAQQADLHRRFPSPDP